VIRAATELFYDKGYDATSVQDIADAVGLLKGSLYYYFEAKEDLLFEILQRVHAGLTTAVADALDGHEDPVDRLRVFLTTHTEFLSKNTVEIAVFFNDFRSLTGDRRAAILKARDSYEAMLVEILHGGQKDGAFASETDPRVAAKGIFGMVNWMHQWYVPGGALTAAAVAESYERMITSGLIPR